MIHFHLLFLYDSLCREVLKSCWNWQCIHICVKLFCLCLVLMWRFRTVIVLPEYSHTSHFSECLEIPSGVSYSELMLIQVLCFVVDGKILADFGMSFTACFKMAFFCLADFFNKTSLTCFTKLTKNSPKVLAHTFHFQFAFFLKYDFFLELNKRWCCLYLV